MKRHIYAFDTPHAARAAIHQLHDCDIGDHAIALIAGSRTELEEIPRRYRDASTDFVPALGRGATVGAAVGLCVRKGLGGLRHRRLVGRRVGFGVYRRQRAR
jgi:hypothetical protein